MKKYLSLIPIIIAMLVFTSSCSNKMSEINSSENIDNPKINMTDNEIVENKDKVVYKETQSEKFKILNIEESVGCTFNGEPQIIDNNIIFYQDNKELINYYLYNLSNNKIYTLPQQKDYHNFVHISDELATAVKFVEIGNNDTIKHEVHVFNWNYKTNKISKEVYKLDAFPDNIYSEYIESEYYNGEIFMAISSKTDKIIKVNTNLKTVNTYDIEPIYFVNNVDTLVVYDKKLYVISDRNNINVYDKDKDEFVKLAPSPTYVTENCKYFIKNRNKFKVYNGEYSAEFKLPYIEKDESITKENLYSVIDAYKNNYIITRYSDNLHLYVDGKLIEFPFVEDAIFIDESTIMYRNEGHLYFYNINTGKRTLMLEKVPGGSINKICETDKSIYFFLYNNILKYKK